MNSRLLVLLLALPALNGCSSLVFEEIKDAGEQTSRRVQAEPHTLERAFRHNDTYYVEASYGDRQVRRFTVVPGAVRARFRPYPAGTAFPKAATVVPIHTERCAAPDCLELARHTVQRRRAGRIERLGRLPRVSRTVWEPRTNASYAKQIFLGVFVLPLALATDIAAVGLYLFALGGGGC